MQSISHFIKELIFVCQIVCANLKTLNRQLAFLTAYFLEFYSRKIRLISYRIQYKGYSISNCNDMVRICDFTKEVYAIRLKSTCHMSSQQKS